MIRPVSDYLKSVADLSRHVGIESKFDFKFSGITSDSKAVETGDLFVALPGSKTHGAS